LNIEKVKLLKNGIYYQYVGTINFRRATISKQAVHTRKLEAKTKKTGASLNKLAPVIPVY
jgi:hypothetical protein